tara:strand:+ start:22 stop:717 length:696 start_codon:yes stop_codon:yes gene_type:complete
VLVEKDKLEICKELIKTCIEMESRGINQGTSGNLSIRYKNSFLITPSSISYNDMTPEDIVEMDWEGRFTGKQPSSEWRFHRDILKSRNDINVVLHCHSINATSLSCHNRNIPAFHYIVGLAGGNNIRCAKYATFGTQELSDNALIAIKDRLACLLGHHGMICLGKTLKQALMLGCEVEAMSKMYIKALSIGNTDILSEEEMVKVVKQMERMSYGKGPEPEGTNDIAKKIDG